MRYNKQKYEGKLDLIVLIVYSLFLFGLRFSNPVFYKLLFNFYDTWSINIFKEEGILLLHSQ